MRLTQDVAPLDELIICLRGYSTRGREVPNPRVAFAKVFEASLDEAQNLRHDSKIGCMPQSLFETASDEIKRLSEPWDSMEKIPAEKLLDFLLNAEGMVYDPGFGKAMCEVGLPAVYDSMARYLREKSQAAIALRRGRNRLDRSHAHKVDEKLGRLMRDVRFAGNPLAGLRDLEMQCGEGSDLLTPSMRDALEGVSRRLWHFATRVDAKVLRCRVLLQQDFGAADVELLYACADLMGIDAHPATASSGDGLDGPLNWDDLI